MKDIVIGDMFAKAMETYAAHFRFFIGLALCGAVLSAIEGVLSVSPDPLMRGVALMLIPASAGVYVLFYLMTLIAMSKILDGEAVDVPEMVAAAQGKLWRAFGAYALFFLIFCAGFFLLIIPGIYFGVIFSFFFYVILFEDRRVWDSFKRSEEIVKGNFWKVFGAHALVMLISAAVFGPVWGAMFLLGASKAWQAVATTVASAGLMPFFCCFYYQLYRALSKRADGTVAIKVYEKPE
ncbi:MAG: hypothetical protein HQL19_00240 [Candidatus Omnitrophica bacterium]|nr:hypothetical protein [Candidatus Omnitrophota bacterium]